MTSEDPGRRDPDFNEPEWEREEEEAAAAEARAIGGVAGDEDLDPADRPVIEGGEGEAEGFELAEEDLIDHASHSDYHSANIPSNDLAREEDAGSADQVDAEADEEQTSEREGDDR
ncbi:MAG TPA: hypothetical protein VGM91_06610 [Conexibacter sp.]